MPLAEHVIKIPPANKKNNINEKGFPSANIKPKKALITTVVESLNFVNVIYAFIFIKTLKSFPLSLF